MQCGRCAHVAPPEAEFCPECGDRLAARCPRCGTSNAATHKFCTKCGLPIRAESEPRPAPTVTEDGERRQLTVMFCDLVGSTALASTVDPEDMRAIVRGYQQACAAVVARFDGHVAQYLGDGLLVYFGYPQAHEDDPSRGVRAALGIVEAIAPLNLSVRVAVHTGMVVVGAVGSTAKPEQLALGDAPNLAARLQALAEPATVVVSDATHRLTERGFQWRSLGIQSLKGFPRPMAVWQVTGETTGLDQARGAPARAMAPLIGREAELSLLHRRWEQAARGDGQVVVLTGEPGIGKSRIAESFLEQARVPASATLRFFCSSYHQHSALHPFVASIGNAAAISADEPVAHKLDKLEQWLARLGQEAQTGALFAALLSIPFESRYPPLELTPVAVREKTFGAIEDLVIRAAAAGATVLVVEDVHWIDPSSASLLERLVDRMPALRALLVVTARPEFTAAWTRLPHVTHLTLNHLARRETAELVAHVAGAGVLAPALVEQIVERAAGIPLYVEEITKAAIESDAEPGAGGPERRLRVIPATLRDSLMGRLDRLGRAKEIAQAAAVIGREFDEELLSAITDLPADVRHEGLERLRQAQLVGARAHAARTVQYFRHALIQEVAYQSLLNATRRRYHLRIAEALERRFTEGAHGEPETIAHHFTEAGADDRAVLYWHRAGQRAAQRSANLEAIEHLRQSLALLAKRLPSPERAGQELSVLITLGPALMATRGWDAPEVREAYSRALALAEETGRSVDLFPAVWGRWLVAHAGGEAQLARDLLDQLFALLHDRDDRSLLLQAHHAAGSTMCSDGELAKTMEHIDTGVALYRFETDREHALVYGGHDPCVCAQSIGALTELVRGNLRRAQELSEAALVLAARVGHVPSVAHADVYRAELTHILREPREAAARSQRVFEMASEKGIAHYRAWALMMLGWARVMHGDVDAGIGTVEEGVTALRTTGIRYHLPHRLTVRAEALLAAGRTHAALEAIEEAIEAVGRTGDVWYESEVLRVKAEILQSRVSPDIGAAQACLDQALALARARGARFWELRAASALARLLAAQDRHDVARSVLVPALRGFGEGELTEVAEAKALIERLPR
jgi:class 3 adenylate cyclase/predicted ATPase